MINEMNELDEYELSLHSSDHRINHMVDLNNQNDDLNALERVNALERRQRDLDTMNQNEIDAEGDNNIGVRPPP